ncbi:hypothetical protein [Breoghania sp. L-A4]|uniref:hypothetical protein n=1 Tax=Breoghania sp. L-A4 TaxID=2304600 RepID=UPI0019684C2B|nr:hypothetical protein [Breoghania sp. L-A4]
MASIPRHPAIGRPRQAARVSSGTDRRRAPPPGAARQTMAGCLQVQLAKKMIIAPGFAKPEASAKTPRSFQRAQAMPIFHHPARAVLFVAYLFAAFAPPAAHAQNASVTLSGEVWVDNWFQFYANGKKVAQDSVSIRTERSFNAERFTFKTKLPVTLAFEFRDFMQNETGLEYIGTRRQQMGDGGAIAQFTDTKTGKVMAVTNSSWRCLTVQHAPVDKSCARERNPTVNKGACKQKVVSRPSNWTAPGFDDSRWRKASTHSKSSVSPKDGYNRIRWSRSAKFIWGPDLERDNIVLCRLTVGDSAPNAKRPPEDFPGGRSVQQPRSGQAALSSRNG